MESVNNTPIKWSKHPGAIAWKSVPDFIQTVLITEGCTLLKQPREQPQIPHIRFQYVPMTYQGNLYYLQKWSHHEWGVLPSQLIFPALGTCPFEALNNGSLLSSLVKKAVAKFYGHSLDNSPFQAISSRHNSEKILSLAV
ncbi:hypothetical protein [Leptothoe sp. PORK10 BA2]|uniref:hypothetical protein n=1 Tax=Leptothoe sp. PORK10 BA2 TaxID=3110254 RepID=UPI002B1FE981|nr:hypothetical protein [Leptothoe sp. PORK10 BA2]MEA5466747.1 hypothetical protein [Leptothoe sp. PORK10 BA2]